MRDRVLKVRTEELYHGPLRNHLLPTFGELGMGDIDEGAVRRWRKERLEAGRKARRPFGPVTVAKAYRLLHAIFTTAVDEDRIVRRNPCRIEGAGKEESDEREIISLPVVFAIAKAVPVRYRALILLTTFADLRWGELAGLRRENIDLDACEIRIVETLAELDKGGLRPETPKSRAGKRTIAFPAELVPELRWHLERFAEPGSRGVVFVGRQGRAAAPVEFPEDLEQGPRVSGAPRPAFSRSQTYGRHALGRDRRDPQRADGPARSLQRAGGDDLPARDERPGSGNCEGTRRAGPRGTAGARGGTGGSAGTRRAQGVKASACGTYVGRNRRWPWPGRQSRPWNVP